MLARALKMAFWVTWDHLGKLILLNLLCTLCVAVPASFAYAAALTGDRATAVTVGLPMAFLSLVLLLPVFAAGAAHLMKTLTDKRDASLRDFFVGVRVFGLRAIGAGMLFWLAVACLVSSVWFYAGKLGASYPILGYAISAFTVWCLVYVLFMSLLLMPALVQKKEGIVATIKITALLVLDNPGFMIGLALQLAALTACNIFPPFFFFLYGVLAMALVSSAYEMLARKYAAIEARRAAEAEGLSPVLPRNKIPIDFNDEQDDYLNRGLRDAIFPWKG